MSNTDQLPIPEPARKDPESFELLRVWIAHKGQHVSLLADMWDDPAAWGILLADLAQHVANAYHDQKGFDRAKTLERIKAGLDVELNSPTDSASGKVQ